MEEKHFYLSPHLDDAVLSCGGLIRKQALAKETVLVVTIFAAIPSYAHLSPFAQSLHAVWGSPADPVKVRRREDESALGFLGAQHVHLDYLEAIYRRDARGRSWLYATNKAIFGPVHKDDLSLIAELLMVLARMLPSEARVYAPLALGDHVDHQIVRHLAQALMPKAKWLAFYEDYPYAEDHEVHSRLPSFRGKPVRPLLVEVSEVLERKMRAIGRYSSQIPMLFGCRRNMRKRLRSYALSVAPDKGPCERYWVSML